MAQIIMVSSGKGGTGKSTLSVLLGARLAARGQRVLLIELDSGLRSVDIMAGVCGKTVYDVSDVLGGRCPPQKAVMESPLYPGLSVVSAPYEDGAVLPEPLRRLVEVLAPHFEVLLLDTAAGLGNPFQAALQVATRALLVLTPDAVALRDGRIVSDKLYAAGCTDIRLVLNRVAPTSFGQGLVQDLDECIDTVCAQLLAVVPESTEVQRAALGSQPLAQGCPAFRAVDNLAARLLGQQVPLAVW